MKREIPLLISGVIGVVFIIQFFIPHEPFHSMSDIFSDWFSIIQACAIWLGALNLVKLSLERFGKPVLLVVVSVISGGLVVGIIQAPGFLEGQLPLILFLLAFLTMAAAQYSRSKSRPETYLAVATVISFAIIIIAGFAYSNGRQFLEPGTSFDYLYQNVYAPLSSTMFAMLAFFVASASYRAFRARNKEATMLLVAAFFVMLGRVPIGAYMSEVLVFGLFALIVWLVYRIFNSIHPSSWGKYVFSIVGVVGGAAVLSQYLKIAAEVRGLLLSQLADWVMNFPNAAGQRAIMIGIALGIASTSLRIILGIERSHLGGE